MEEFDQGLQSRATRVALLVFFCALMLALAELGAALTRGDLGFSTLWPPCGLYFLALTFAPNIKRDWISLFIAAAIANLITDWLIHQSSLLVTVCFIVSNSASAMCAAAVARQFLSTSSSNIRLRETFILMACGLLIQAPIAATFGLWFQNIFWDRTWTWIKWVAWWSSNAIGISCFGTISFYLLQQSTTVFFSKKSPANRLYNYWNILDGTRPELAALWIAFISLAAILLFELMPPWGLFLLNVLPLIWAFRFGILHSSFVLAVGCIVLVYHTISSWGYLSPFSGLLLFAPPSSPALLKISTVVSVQLFIIERAVVVNLAAALFTDLHLKQSALVEAAASRERLMARMSHEIRTPLSGVLGLIEAWAIKEKNEQRAQDLQLILNSGSQLKRVIDDVLDYSKLSAKKLNIEPTHCQLRDLLSEIISLHSGESQRKGISLELNVSENIQDEILIDSHRLRQILNNLAANAIKFTAKGFVRISAHTGLPHDMGLPILRVTVEDSGIGISQSAMKNLFQPFEQIGTETTRAYGGTGLGLAICRELTELLGGRIEVKSTLGVGSRFTVHLPFSRISEGQPRKPKNGLLSPLSAVLKAQTKNQILVVEDDPISQVVATRFIEAEGFSVRVANNGPQALEILEQHGGEFALVLMDYFMPAMDGCEVTRRFRSSEKTNVGASHLPIVGLTASVLAVDHERCRQSGMDDVLLKPLEREKLRATLLKLITRMIFITVMLEATRYS